ncbi:MAG TPA: helix-turn-helix transcriptional regulator [Longimicrobium sp.]|nr:helix-turn-helix transcriptional regulator [Longimicrobium sp.]
MFTINDRSVVRALSRAEILKRFGDTLREHRQRAGLSQEKLAARAGIDRTYVGGAERGERNVALVNIVRLAAALNISAAELLDRIDKQD